MIEAQIQHARLLMQQERYDKAAESLQAALSQQPDNPLAHALIAVCLGQEEKFDQATHHIQEALRMAPSVALVHAIQADLFYKRNRPEEGLEAAKRAVELEPDSPANYAACARGFILLKQWAKAQECAELGLAIDAEDVGCLNLRAVAQRQQGKTGDANESLRTAMERDPDNPYSHANLGWSLLQQGNREEAIQHFGEALRLEPGLEMAQAGLIEALKSRNTLYAWMLRYFLWMATLSGGKQWMILIGGYVAYRVVFSFTKNNPDWAPYSTPILALYIAFAVMTWIASPLFDLVLRLDRYGRLILTKEQIRTSNMIGLCLIGVLAGLLLYPFALTRLPLSVAWFPTLLVSASFGVLLPVLSRIYACDKGWPRNVTIAMAAVLGLGSLLCIAAGTISLFLPAEQMNMVLVAISSPFYLLCVGALISQFALNYLVGVRVRR
ncbi:tetratricopeptide repeat protein [Blastopirellula sp. JC732]|uniref:Tetratricopeptide repeat protein n=1 Tax=Blastopirellula sediminis TaxID=2894196 RepID=A0A9X1MNV4_9BACT|nr:tetratricopeptide repeat protein [Blastopirellula sediminis]MCC9607097.1 tetratricopeptide repeat protein [Blastopirellula sediminis]MCC9629610.1 tetratricopeptide repeat protein [Blastopirellula sediminis]